MKTVINRLAILQALVFGKMVLLGVFFKSEILLLEAELGNNIVLYAFPIVLAIGGAVLFISKPLRERELSSSFIYQALLKHPLTHITVMALIIFSIFNSNS